jgi:hypothetical protein
MANLRFADLHILEEIFAIAIAKSVPDFLFIFSSVTGLSKNGSSKFTWDLANVWFGK